jgi:hypothetical protein
MEIPIEELFNKHKNKPCIVFGGSQTMMDFDYEKFNGIIISIGSSILRTQNKFNVDYIVSANNEFPVPEIPFHLNFLNKFKKNTTWVMSDTACYSKLFKEDKRVWEEKLKINYVKYDDRHFNLKPCYPRQACCEYIELYKNRKTIFEALYSKHNQKNPIKKTGTTVAEIGLVLSLILGCNPIFMQGIDIPKEFYHGKQLGEKYYGYQSKYADTFLDKTTVYLRIKYLFYYLKRFNFKPYLIRLYHRFKIGKNYSFFYFTQFKESKKIFFELGKLAKKKNVKIFILSKNSTLCSIKNFKYFESKSIKKEFSKFFKKKKTHKTI